MAGPNFRGTSSLLVVVAIAVMGGFLFWLYQEASSLDQEVTPVMEDTASAQFTLDSLRAQGGSVGRTVTLDSAPVASNLGRGVFTLRLDDTLSYPVLMDSDLIQRNTNVIGGDLIRLRGRFYTLTDSIRSEWVTRGAVDSASADSLPTSSSFLLADSVVIVVES